MSRKHTIPDDEQPNTSSRALAKFLGIPHDEVLALIEENRGYAALFFERGSRVYARSAVKLADIEREW